MVLTWLTWAYWSLSIALVLFWSAREALLVYKFVLTMIRLFVWTRGLMLAGWEPCESLAVCWSLTVGFVVNSLHVLIRLKSTFLLSLDKFLAGFLGDGPTICDYFCWAWLSESYLAMTTWFIWRGDCYTVRWYIWGGSAIYYGFLAWGYSEMLYLARSLLLGMAVVGLWPRF